MVCPDAGTLWPRPAGSVPAEDPDDGADVGADAEPPRAAAPVGFVSAVGDWCLSGAGNFLHFLGMVHVERPPAVDGCSNLDAILHCSLYNEGEFCQYN